MAKVVGFISEKGGTGKTTACYHIAVALNRYHDDRVLVLDADYQRGDITGRFFPDLIESFGTGQMPGTSLLHKFQQLRRYPPIFRITAIAVSCSIFEMFDIICICCCCFCSPFWRLTLASCASSPAA